MGFFSLICFIILDAHIGCAAPPISLRFSWDRPLSADKCLPCHPGHYSEWKDSTHAGAWTDRDFLDSLKRTGTPACWGCHASAVPLPSQEAPVLRESNLLEGVNCTSCHGAECPLITLDTPEPSSASETTTALDDGARICGLCHKDTFMEWSDYIKGPGEDGEKTTCVDCHMPRGAIITGGTEEYSSFVTHRNHTLRVSETPSLTLEAAGPFPAPNGQLEFTIFVYNRDVGHWIPTGLYGLKEVRLEVWMEGGEPESVQTRRFFVENRTALKPGRNGPYRFFFSGNGNRVNARVIHLEGAEKEIRVLAELPAS